MAGLGLAGAGMAQGASDALQEIVKQRMLEQQMAEAEQQRQFDRVMRTKEFASGQENQAYTRKQTEADDAKKNAMLRYQMSSGRPAAELMDSTTQGFGANATPAAGLPALPGTNVAGVSPPVVTQGRIKPIDIPEVGSFTPPTQEQNTAAAERADVTKAMNTAYTVKPTESVQFRGQTIAQGGPAPIDRKEVAGYIGPNGEPVSHDEPTGKYYIGQTETPISALTVKPVQRDPNAAQARVDAQTQRSYQYHQGRLDKLATPIAAQKSKIDETVSMLDANSPQADALVVPKLLTALVSGQGSGLRINNAEIANVTGGRSNIESFKAALNKWSTDPAAANSITPAQRQQMRALLATAQAKAQKKLDLLDHAGADLVNADTPRAHATIMQQLNHDLTTMDSEPASPAGGTTTRPGWGAPIVAGGGRGGGD